MSVHLDVPGKMGKDAVWLGNKVLNEAICLKGKKQGQNGKDSIVISSACIKSYNGDSYRVTFGYCFQGEATLTTAFSHIVSGTDRI